MPTAAKPRSADVPLCQRPFPPKCYAAGVGTLLALAAIVVVVVGALYWLGRDIDPDDRNNPPFDVRRVGG